MASFFFKIRARATSTGLDPAMTFIIFSRPFSIIRKHDSLLKAIERKTESHQTSVSKKTLSKLVTKARNCTAEMCSAAHEYLKLSQSSFALNIHEKLIPPFSEKGISLQGVKLSHANLSCAQLNSARLSHAVLNCANLGGANLIRARLRNAKLKSANLLRANLSGARMGNAELCGANLRKARLSSANLRKAVLCEVNLSKASMCRANLTSANLRGANLRDANLYKAEVCGADLSHATLEYADLRSANLKGANLAYANLTGTKLQGADLTGIHLNGANLRYANLTGAKLDEATRFYAWLTGARRDNTPGFSRADLRPSEQKTCLAGIAQFVRNIAASELQRDIQLNHPNNAGSGLLPKIDGIACPALKSALMQEVIEALQATTARGVNVSDTYPSLRDILLRQALYRNNPTILSFMQTVLMPDLFNHARQGELPWRSPTTPSLLMTSMEVLQNMGKDALINQGAAVNQLLYAAGKYPADDAIQTAASCLRTQWMDTLSHSGLVQAIEEQFLDPNTDYVVLSDDKSKAIAFDENYMAQICGDANAQSNWGSAYVFERQDATPFWYWRDTALREDSIANVLQPFPWIQTQYLAQSGRAFLPVLIDIVTSADQEFAAAFTAVRDRKRINSDDEKWISLERQLQLGALFAPCFASERDGRALSTEHVDTLRNAAFALGLARSDKKFARFLLSLATVYTRASSSAFFGSESDSPQALRDYAAGLLEAACSADTRLIDADVKQDWHNRLTGKGNAFSCTAVLSSMMHAHIKGRASSDQALHDIFSSIYPIAW